MLPINSFLCFIFSKLKCKISPYGIKSSLDVSCFEKLWIGKDYTNFILKDFQNLDRPFEGKNYIFLFIYFL